MSEHIDHLASLHTALIDSLNGYKEALKDAEGKGLTPLFRDMIALRTRHSDELAGLLQSLGQQVDDKGSFMTTVHRTVIGVRALFGDLDERILPGLIDGEERIVSYYDDALASANRASSATAEVATLTKQRSEILLIISDMQRRRDMAA